MSNQLDRAIYAHADAAFSFLEALVMAASTVGAEQAAMDVFALEAEVLGLKVQRLPFANAALKDARAGIVPQAQLLTPNRYQLLAHTSGDGELTLLLNGHLDVVPAESQKSWASPPFKPERRNGRLYGRGSGDMKSGFAVGTLALRALQDIAPDLFAKKSLGFLAAVEEECTGNGTLSSITDHGVKATEVVVLEPTNLGLLLGGVGVLWVEIDVASRSGHGYAAGVNSVDLGMQLIEHLRQWTAELWRTHPDPIFPSSPNPYNLNLGKVNAGDWTSSVPSLATFSVRVGFPRSWTPDQAEQALREVITSFATKLAFAILPQVTLTGFRAKGYFLEPDSRLARDLGAAHRAAHGVDPVAFSIGSTTDARTYLNDFGIHAICYGAVAHDIHGIDECVELQSIVDAARTLARFILMRFGAEDLHQ